MHAFPAHLYHVLSSRTKTKLLNIFQNVCLMVSCSSPPNNTVNSHQKLNNFPERWQISPFSTPKLSLSPLCRFHHLVQGEVTWSCKSINIGCLKIPQLQGHLMSLILTNMEMTNAADNWTLHGLMESLAKWKT